ncbi:metallophosphatase [Arenibacter sp. GZD96]|uniref:hypothetical protein n=1 Tax=Aurantibrevibacter litoralis TaxID=3106030 RepID=UPI002AFFA57E|nr:hypothetical protein [Arenibacter sp. GZD-96]MEA1786730.1 metallophosphatase [Arenibacter sp. GZD-96]
MIVKFRFINIAQFLSLLGVLFLGISSGANAQEVETSIFITANTGEAKNQSVLAQIGEDAMAKETSTLLIVGNGLPKNGFLNPVAEAILNEQLTILTAFPGTTIFTPGENGWDPETSNGIKNLEKFIQKNSKAKFKPDDVCAISKTDISDNVTLITLDSQWFLEDWDNYSYLNDNCDIKNRNQFFIAFEELVKKNRDKLILVAVHHPVYTRSKQGLLTKTGGFRTEDFENKQYRSLRNRLSTIARQADNVIFISGHDRNLQYLNPFGVPQIISGASGATQATAKAKKEEFTSDITGYARLDVSTQGKITVNFIETVNGQAHPIFTKTIALGDTEDVVTNFKPEETYPQTVKASIYTAEEATKKGLYERLWGKHYRELYGAEVAAPVVFLDTLMGGLQPIKKGGGQQSKSLRLKDEAGREFVMRALRKSTTQFLQANAFQDVYLGDALDGTFIDAFLLDFYTTSNPYTPFVIGKLSDPVGVYHTNPTLYFVPKQETLGRYNNEFGDELYLIEEHVGDTQTEVESFGNPKKILSTAEVLEVVHKNGKSVVDEPSYIRARLFDMLIGDWDRHEDQWRWALFESENGTQLCKPIPRDRDQAFSKFDGAMIEFLTRAIPGLRKMQSFDETLRSPKWFATSPYHLDINLLDSSDWSEWEKQALFIQESLTDADIELAFEGVPDAVKGKTIDDIKQKLRGRKANLLQIAKKYYDYVSRFEIIIGTEKSDIFTITRSNNGKTTIEIQRKDLELLNRTFHQDVTKEIWIYGLDGEDTFIVDGESKNPIDIKIVGGRKNDVYDFRNTKRVKLYDYKSKPNTIVQKGSKKWLVDDYEINDFDHTKMKHSTNQILPLIAFNPDDGVRLGVLDNYTFNGIQGNPFTQKHSFSASYYTATSGYDFSYRGEFSNIFHNWNFAVEGLYTSPNFSINFFGIGNETPYDRDAVELDFNRTRIRQWKVATSLIYRGKNGGSFHIKPLIESFELENTNGRFVNTLAPNSTVFEKQVYGGGEISYQFLNEDNASYPTLALDIELTAGYKTNIDNTNADNSFAYIQPSFGITHRITQSGAVVFATKMAGELILGDDFEFYHGAQIGGNNGLRGFRNERFVGKYAFYQNTDIRFVLGKIRTNLIPLRYGISLGFDHGRVWTENDDSKKWHTSPGTSFWVNGLGAISANFGYFNGSDGGRFVFGLGVSL